MMQFKTKSENFTHILGYHFWAVTVSRQMYPLQERSHKMCFYSGIRDTTRVTVEIPKQRSLCEWVSRLITDKIDEEWDFGHEPFTRLDRAPEVSFPFSFCLQFLYPTAA